MKNLLVRFVDLVSSPIEAMEESRPDLYESLKEQLQQVKAEINKPKRTGETLKENLQTLEEQIVHVERAINIVAVVLLTTIHTNPVAILDLPSFQ